MTQRRSPLTLSRIIERIAGICPPRHRELMRGMVAELEAIAHRGERARFALGALAAIGRLALVGHSRTTVQALGQLVGVREPDGGNNLGGPSMSKLTTRELLRRHAAPFAVSFASLTVLMVAKQALRLVAQLGTRGTPAGTIVEVVLLTVPFILALTIPMAVFIAVSWVFARLGAEGVVASARRERQGVRRLVAPVLGAAAVIAALTLVSNTEVVPRANERLVEVLGGAPREPSDRTMTLGELQEAARIARTETGADAGARAAGFEVEIQKKFALAAACLILALLGAVTAMRFPRGGVPLVAGASGLVFTGYYLSSTVGESLADRQLLSPLVAMWMANAVLLAVALLLVWRPGRSGPTTGEERFAIEG